jgi:predicted metalloendopeptidase
MMQSDPHPVAKYRVIGPLSTLPEFQKAFQRRGDAPSNEVESVFRGRNRARARQS